VCTVHARQRKQEKEKQSFFRKTNPKIGTGAIKNAERVGFVAHADPAFTTPAPSRPNARTYTESEKKK
jgi:hypothetical protein